MKESEILSIKQRFGIIGNSPLLNQAINVAAQVAPTDMSVLITGESGSGKESFSKIIHSLSKRKHGQFIAINCGAIPEGTIDSELFGHEKGSFTGAHEARKGYFEVTDGGTIFLDEIGEMPMSTQARLLRVLENGEFIKVGSSKVQKTNVRVLAATNVNLINAVEKKKFREDLYYRLNTVPIYVPALRERGSDIELLFRKFAYDFGEQYHVDAIKLTDGAKEALMKFRFPGNIRQLKNLAEQISVLEMNRTLDEDTMKKYLPQEISNLPALLDKRSGATAGSEGFSERDILYKILFDMKKDMNELKKLVLQNAGDSSDRAEIIKEHGKLFSNLELKDEQFSDFSENPMDTPVILNQDDYQDFDSDKVEDIAHETEQDDSLSIEKKEKELIIRALRKNRNKRKYAAQDLGISERTLYRKIKHYELED
ncbi:sigma-54 dependent transcriptional regulator [Reichenbachiella carrageenanivorans]|uniref:Sigma-54 dependent transcriptional regulator n=1 Tax=Reichenbachiella carrageenanivorans TaxID=2979869 RepID=A0ABY6CXP8_9BACT|nr:sigma-54 dependent transcriptional regulator [Reichenbachiella carrageenanivorans]UXX78150.1 sigma-54 dependent transcriptional regulator [Reichenbachiella carrageenanivorans]